jgi:hypothetical protein
MNRIISTDPVRTCSTMPVPRLKLSREPHLPSAGSTTLTLQQMNVKHEIEIDYTNNQRKLRET